MASGRISSLLAARCWRGLALLPLAVLLLGGCETVDVGTAPADLNRCRPDPAFFYQQIWPNYLNKDLGGNKRCSNVGCHADGSGRQMVLIPPTSMGAIPLPPDWEQLYHTVTNQMECTNVAKSTLLTRPTGESTHGAGEKLFEPNGPEAQLILMWVMVK